jgi:hypothetical protein
VAAKGKGREREGEKERERGGKLRDGVTQCVRQRAQCDLRQHNDAAAQPANQAGTPDAWGEGDGKGGEAVRGGGRGRGGGGGGGACTHPTAATRSLCVRRSSGACQTCASSPLTTHLDLGRGMNSAEFQRDSRLLRPLVESVAVAVSSCPTPLAQCTLTHAHSHTHTHARTLTHPRSLTHTAHSHTRTHPLSPSSRTRVRTDAAAMQQKGKRLCDRRGAGRAEPAMPREPEHHGDGRGHQAHGRAAAADHLHRPAANLARRRGG